jgi:acyl carrier protein
VPSPIPADELDLIQRNFRRCGEPTINAIVRFREERDREVIPAIVRGIVQRYLPREGHEALKTATAETLLSDLRIESLTMLEIVLDVQEALNIDIEDHEMRAFRSLGDVEQFLERKVATDA